MGIEQFLGASLKHTEGLQFLVLLYLPWFSVSKVVGWLWLTGRFGASGIFLLEKLVQNGNVDFHTDVFVLQDWTSSQHFIFWSHIMEISDSD